MREKKLFSMLLFEGILSHSHFYGRNLKILKAVRSIDTSYVNTAVRRFKPHHRVLVSRLAKAMTATNGMRTLGFVITFETCYLPQE
ncbi:hypothetical protein CEXT_568591 [Caerostris extrusa]|uniref:Uncharacterized protein n=1 Tax=Caerostris extrusa TaxID=172846 RepID=A0AAV4YBH5_CAEEX|nr:hypothetical protein CEXT_568591 [Caerostris extrusa]